MEGSINGYTFGYNYRVTNTIFSEEYMKQLNRIAIVEGLKELGRLAFLGAVTAAFGWAAQQLELFDPTSLQYIVGTAVLRAVDRFVHKSTLSVDGISPI